MFDLTEISLAAADPHPRNYFGADAQYLRLVEQIMVFGVDKGDRTGTGTRSLFGTTMRFDLSGGRLPLLTTKKVITRSIIHELLWMISGDTNIRYLKDNNVSIWDSWLIPGTEEYRPMTDEEIQHALRKRHLTTPPSDGLLAVAFGEMEALDQESQEEIYTTTFDDGTQTLTYYFWKGGYQRAYEYITGDEAKVLSGGDIGKGYGRQWRCWEDTRVIDREEWDQYQARGFEFVTGYNEDEASAKPNKAVVYRKIDQLADVIKTLKTNPDSRRIIVSAWNISEIDEMALPPCHTLFQFYTKPLNVDERLVLMGKGLLTFERQEGASDDAIHADLDQFDIPRHKLSCLLFMRSNDIPLGNPFNVVQYALLTHMVAHVVNMTPDEFIWVGGDSHIYQNQFNGIGEQLTRESLDCIPKVVLNPEVTDLFEFQFSDIAIEGYEHLSAISFPVAV